MYSPDAAFLQAEVEQILEHHGKLSILENEPTAVLRVWSAHEFPLDIVKNDRLIKLFIVREPNLILEAQPNVTLEISRDGKWNFVEMKNSYFIDQDETVNSFEYWDCVVRFDNFYEGFVEEVA